MLSLTAAGTALVLLPLALILYQVVAAGVSGLSWTFLTSAPLPPGESGGGMGNAVLGTAELLIMALAVGLPLGLMAGLYVSELGHERFAAAIRLAADVLNGVPTIVTGVFIYALVVVPMRRFSGVAGALALACVMLPVMARASEEVLRTVPSSYREAALALGASPGRVLRGVILRAARPGLLAAALLATARVAGETAPLLLTSLNSSLFTFRPDRPMAALTVQIYDYAIAPYADWHRQAWTAALVLILMVLLLNFAAHAWGAARRA